MSESGSLLTWRLSDPGMGLLERAGLAALYMTLRAAEEQGVDLSPLSWNPGDLTPESVTLRWHGPDKPAITALFRFAWKVRDGVLYLPAIHRDLKQRDFGFLRLASHNGILSTFLQHVNVQLKGDLVRMVEQVNEGEDLSFQYLSLDPIELLTKRAGRKTGQKTKAPAGGTRTAFKPSAKKKAKEAKDTLKPIADLGEFFTSKGLLSSKPVSLSSWVMPGIAGRYGNERAWNGPAKNGLLLILAPIACLYQDLRGQGNNWVFVVPDVNDLTEFDEIRPFLGLDPTHVDIASLGDAGLRFSAEYATRSIRKEVPIGCLVTAMGRVGYYKSQ